MNQLPPRDLAEDNKPIALADHRVEEPEPDRWVSDRFVQFVDIVFGVVVVQGLVKYSDLILDPSVSWFAFVGLIGVYVLTTLSWVGYHLSMNQYPYVTTSLRSW